MKSAYLYWFLFCLTIASSAWGQLRTAPLTKLTLPKTFKYKGQMVEGLSWRDSTGKHFVVLTETGAFTCKNQKSEYTDCDGACHDAELYAYHFVQANDSSYTLWQLTDFERTCPFDVVAQFAKGSLVVTDFNRNGVAEIWFVYKTTCTSDVSPRTMKLFMYEEKNKYAMRGTSKVTPGPEAPVGGAMQMDVAFKNSPSNFKAFAARLWNKFVADTYD